MNTLFVRLEGPLQAWGLRARWGERDTADVPTKSGVIGLLGGALGLQRPDDQLRQLSDTLRMGVRVDLPGTLLHDYHTTGGGRYGTAIHQGGTRFHDEPYAGGVLSPQVVKGRIKVKVNATTGEPETDTSVRVYLADASFLAALQATDTALIARLARALQAPVWPAFLGRKACVPTAYLFAGLGQYPDLHAALTAQPVSPRVQEAWAQQGRPSRLRLVLEVGPGAGNRQNDAIGVPARRVFHPRFVQDVWWSVPPPDNGTPAAAAPINTLEG